MNQTTLVCGLLAAPLGMCVIHAIVSRVARATGYGSLAPQVVVFTAVMLGNVPAVWLAWEFARKAGSGNAFDIVCAIAYVLLTYNGFGFCYFHFFNATETSLHVHIMMEILAAGSIPSEKLTRRYSAKEMIGVRIERMIALGQLQERDGYFVLNDRTLLLVGKIFDAWRRVLRMSLSPD
jgi:hypothetical protein